MKRQKRLKDRKINGKCTNGTNRRSRVWPVYFIHMIKYYFNIWGIRKKRKKGAQKKGGENSPVSPLLDPRLYTNITRVLLVYSASHLSLKSLPVSLSVYQVPSGRLHTSTCTVLYNGANGTTTTLTFAEARDCFLSFSGELISLSCLNEWDLQDDLSLRTAKNSERFYADPCQAVDIKIRKCHTGVHATYYDHTRGPTR